MVRSQRLGSHEKKREPDWIPPVVLPKLSEEEIAYRVEAIEKEYLAEEIQKRVGACGVPPDLIDADAVGVDTLPSDARGIWGAATTVVNSFIGRQGIIALIEGYGTGKSTIGAGAVLRECKALRVARYLNAWNYIERFSAASKGSAFKETAGKVEEFYSRAPLLVIDELHEQQPLFGELNRLAIRRLILRRWEFKLTTVLISNDTSEAFADAVGDSVISRMNQKGCGALIRFTYQDLRRRR